MQPTHYSFLITATLLLNYTFISAMEFSPMFFRRGQMTEIMGGSYYRLFSIERNQADQCYYAQFTSHDPKTGDRGTHQLIITRDDIFPFQAIFENSFGSDKSLDQKFKKILESLSQTLEPTGRICGSDCINEFSENCSFAPESCFVLKNFLDYNLLPLYAIPSRETKDRLEWDIPPGTNENLQDMVNCSFRHATNVLRLFTRAICGLKRDGPTSHIARTKIIKQLIDFFPLHEQYRIDLNAGQEETQHETLIDLIHAVAHGSKTRFFPYGLPLDRIDESILESARNEIADGAGQKEPLHPTIVALAAEKDMKHLIKSGFLDELQGLFNEPNLLTLVAQFSGDIRRWDLTLARRLWQEAGYEETDEIYDDYLVDSTQAQGFEGDS